MSIYAWIAVIAAIVISLVLFVVGAIRFMEWLDSRKPMKWDGY